MKKIKDLDVSEASEESDIRTKIIKKENADIFSKFTCQSFSNMIDVYILSASLKLAKSTPVFKKGAKKPKGKP